jgi:tRNA/tmRNA/rRNA uracil-C5-methylase (TrmA/RlmC/RlmD family)
VPFVLPGEVVEAEITEVKKQFARARLVRILEPAPIGSRRAVRISANAAAASISTSITPPNSR